MTALATKLQGDISPPQDHNPLAAVARMIERGESVPVELFERVIALQERVDANNARAAYNAAMVAIQKEMPTVVHDKRNTQTNSNYASMEQVMATIKPIALKHGITHAFHEGAAPQDGQICVVGIFRHVSGHEERFTRFGKIDNVGLKGNPNSTEIQGAQKSVTYLSRRMLCSVLGIVVADEDKDGSSGAKNTPITKEQQKEIHDLLVDLGISNDPGRMDSFLKWMAVDELSLMTQADYAKAKSKLDRQKAKAAK